MRRDLLVTALIFSFVGFIAGALFTGAIGGESAPAPPPRPAASTGASGTGLPEGHPPMELAQRWQELQRRAEADPDDAQAALDLANFLYDRGAWDQSSFWYEKSLALKPGDANVRTDYATTLLNQSLYDDAIRAYEQALQSEPNKPQALFGLARAKLEGKGDRAGAEGILRTLEQAHPDFEGIRILAELLEGNESGR